MYIDSQKAFDAYVDSIAGARVLAIDTEFLREKTYYATLCLLQLNADGKVAVVDPFKVDISILKPILLDESTMKLFHAGRQDIEIILHEIGCVPAPIFDTQVAAALTGQTQQVGYGPLVHSLCGVKIAKADSFTDWSQRPLTESQIQYAAEDVIYLPEMYDRMCTLLKKKGRLGWLANDFAELSSIEHYVVDERERYRKLKHVSQLTRRQMAAAREMAAWRELQAQSRNIPRKWVLSDEQIVEACKREPRSIDDLFVVRGMREKLPTADARVVIQLVRSALDASPDTWPEVDRCSKNEPNVDVQVDLMTAIVRKRSKQNDIAFQTLASHSELQDIARGHYEDVELLRGWRREIVGEELLALMRGELSLSIKNGRVRVTNLLKKEDR